MDEVLIHWHKLYKGMLLTQHASELYNQMLASGYDLNQIVTDAYNKIPTSKD